MTQDRRRGRRVAPKSHGTRPPVRPPHEPANRGTTADPGADPGDSVGANLGSASESGGTGTGGSMGASRPAGTRSQNRAAKRATMGVRPKAVRGGRVSARQGRSSNIGLIALVAGAIAIGAAAIVLGNPFGTPAASPGASSGAVASHGDGTCPTSQPAALSPADARTVTMVTTKGTITMRIDGTVSPIAAGNFVALVACHFYDGIVFHRIMPGFVIQGGDPQGTGSGGPGYEIQDDPVDVPYKRGTVAMARTPQPNSQGSQFFIILSDDADSSLSAAEYPYAILGQVTAGMDVVDEIAKGENTGGNEGRALEPVTMTSVTVGPYVPASPAPSTAPSAAPSSAPSIAPTSAPS